MDPDHLARIRSRHPGLRRRFISGDHAIHRFVRRAGEQWNGGSDLQEHSSIHGGECIPRFRRGQTPAARAWAYKEQFVEFWGQADAAQGFDFFTQWKRSVMRSRLTKVKTVAKTLHQHLTNLLTFFMHPITNAVSEGFNSRIQAIKADARDFRRFFNYRSR